MDQGRITNNGQSTVWVEGKPLRPGESLGSAKEPDMEEAKLPEPKEVSVSGYNVAVRAFTADQMLAYGRECARIERERCANLCWERAKGAPKSMAAEAQLCAAAIRGPSEQ